MRYFGTRDLSGVFGFQSPSRRESRDEPELAAITVSNYSWHLGSALIFKRARVMSRAYRTPRPHDHITFLSDIAESAASDGTEQETERREELFQALFQPPSMSD